MQTVALSALLLVGQAAQGGAADAGLVDAWLKVSLDHAKAYRITPQSQPDAAFKLLPKPIFRHSQPVRGDDIGAVYLWVNAGGHPEVIGTVFAYSAGGGARWVAHEVHSLSDQPLTARWEEKIIWAPEEKGVQWQPIPQAPAPAATPAQRLIQMRALARRFRAASMEAEDKHWQLRLVPNPVYRNESKPSAESLDSAVFLFCQGTDPEIVLLLEARKNDKTKGFHWQCAFAAFSDYALRAELDGREIWKVGRYPHRNNKGPHWLNGQFRLARLPEATQPGKDNE